MYGCYQVTMLPDITEEEIHNPPLVQMLPAGTKWLPSCRVKMYGGYQVTRLPGITKEEICIIHL